MRIAVNTRFLLNEKLEGMGLFTHEVVRRLVEQYPQHEFIFLFDRKPNPKYIYGPNVKPVVLFPPARHPFLFVWWFEWSIVRELKKQKVDVFLSPDNFLSLSTNTATVLVTHDLAHAHFPEWNTFFQRKYYQYFAPKFNRKAHRIVAVSTFTKNDIIHRYGVKASKIDVACNGCREIFHQLNEEEKQTVRSTFSDGQPYFFYVGAVHPRKNVHRLIEAFDCFKRLSHSPVKLLIAGRFAWSAGMVKERYDQSNHQKDIHFLGFVNDGDLANLMGAALACTYVSLFEGFGIPILEAMNCEVPVITSDTSSMPEVAGDAALLVNPKSANSISSAMQQIWENSHLRSKLVERGRRQCKKFTWQKATDIVYQNLLLATGK